MSKQTILLILIVGLFLGGLVGARSARGDRLSQYLLYAAAGILGGAFFLVEMREYFLGIVLVIYGSIAWRRRMLSQKHPA